MGWAASYVGRRPRGPGPGPEAGGSGLGRRCGERLFGERRCFEIQGAEIAITGVTQSIQI